MTCANITLVLDRLPLSQDMSVIELLIATLKSMAVTLLLLIVLI